MKPEEAISHMIAPGQVRPNKGTKGVIQIHVTRACDKSCFNCTQGSNLKGPYYFMPPELFEKAVASLKTYPWIVGLFGGNPATHPEFITLCEILRASGIPRERLGLWCNNPIKIDNAQEMAITFNPAVSNLNVHGHNHDERMTRLIGVKKEDCKTCNDAQKAYDLFKVGWPNSRPFGLAEDSRHSPVFVSMEDLTDITEDQKWDAISRCEINQKWSASIGLFRGKLRAWFCEIAMAQSILNEHDVDYPDTGLDPTQDHFLDVGLLTKTGPYKWWELPIQYFRRQIKNHCLNCSVPLRGYGSLAQAGDSEGVEMASETYREVYIPKRPGREVQFVTLRSELESKNLPFIDYLGGARK